MNFAEGTLWSEGGAGTNAIGTALALDHAVQVFGPEHFSDPVQRWTCSAAPIHDPDTGAVIGVIDLTGDLSTVHPHSPRRRHRHRARRRGQPPARAAGARRPPARPLRRPRRRRTAPRSSRRSGRAIGAVPAGWSVAGRLAIPPGGGALMLPSGVARGRRAGLPHAGGLRRARGRVQARDQAISRPLVKLALPRARPRDAGDRATTPRRAAPAPGRDPRAAVREPGRDERRARCAPTCTATAAVRLQRARRGVAGCASCSAPGSTPTATA